MSQLVTQSTLQKTLEAHRTKMSEAQRGKKVAPHILIIGGSGTGKSRSIKELPPAETLVLNVESKQLPFANAATFEPTMATGFSHTNEIVALIKAVQDDPTIKYIVMDSLSKFLEMLMAEATLGYKGYDKFNFYNNQIFQFVELLKKITNKIVILLSIDEIVKLEQPSGALIAKRHASVEGKVWFAKLEKEFAIVLFTDPQLEPNSKPPKINYKFATQTDGITSAKSPEGLFDGAFHINNDLKFVVDKVEKYFGIAGQ